MKKISLLMTAIFSLTLCVAQQKEGKIIYERTMQLQIRMAGMNDEMERLIPKSRTDKFELVFGNNQSLWKAVPQDEDDDGLTGDGGGVQIRMVGQGNNDVLFNDFNTAKRVEQREVLDKKFIIDDSIRSLKWKMTGETRTILNLPCMKATATNISTRTMMNMDNGKMERNEVQDTALIVAWFTSSIPVPAGPAEYQGQLPGLILEMDISNGRQVFKALEASPKADLTVIKQPTGKKHYTPEEFRKERDKMMEEMQRNHGGPGRTIRIN